ncbi:hypothetical protein U9M48_025778 [Paspalum notatum var. saurae]|uniref:Cyclin-like domain-containing protein n=1 Tax=Paspalum notatum var. saurae TaxID=547442 RepID=A0AAQ3WYP9_PASNO
MGAAAWEEDGGERFRSWYLSREEVERGSPSRRDGVGAAKEAELRATYCSFIRDVCARLHLPQITLSTAILLCHRFYLRQSHARNEWQTVATVCVFLASKIEDTPCSVKHVAIVAYETMYRKNPDAAKRIHEEDFRAKQVALILVGETLLLSTIRFDFNIQHPYEPLKLALKNLGIYQKEVRETAMNLINDTLPTTLGVQFKPHYIAAGSLFLAAKFHNVMLPSQNGRVWWHEFDVAPKQLQAVTQQMSELFKKRGPCSMGPVIKPAPTSTPTEKQQIKPTPTPAPMDKYQIKPTPIPMEKQQVKPAPMEKQQINPAPMDKRQINPAPMDKQKIKPAPMDKWQIKPAPLDKQQIKSTPMVKQQIKPAPIQTDGQQIINTLDPAWRHTQSSRRSFSNSNTEAATRVPVGSSFDSKSTVRSARNEESQYQRMKEESQYRRMKEESQYRRMKEESEYRRMKEESQYRRNRINHNLDIVADMRLEEQSRWETHKADRACHLRSVSKDMNPAKIMDLTRQKRRIQEVGGFGVIVFETNSWKKQKVERR